MSKGADILSAMRAFPGAVLRLRPDGVITESNGRLEDRLGQQVVGIRFEDLVDEESSRAKWRRSVEEAGSGEGGRSELILGSGPSLTDPLAFSILRQEGGGDVWVVELPADPRLERLNVEVHTINAALNTTQRELSKEKRRLDRALEELQERQIELARSNRDLEQFAHVISHDLKAPLRSVRSYADFLRQDLNGTLSAEAAGFLQRIISRAAEMDAMINGVLRYARAGRSSAPREAVDVGKLVHSLIELHRLPAGARVSIASDLPVIKTDPIQLRQVLQNLIANALRYGAGDDPVLEIDWRAVEGFYELLVSDNGPGIPEYDQERIWDLLYTTGETQDDDSGSGIGLALVKRLVEGNGGSVSVLSEEGKGATFIVRWPIGHAAKDGISNRSAQTSDQ